MYISSMAKYEIKKKPRLKSGENNKIKAIRVPKSQLVVWDQVKIRQLLELLLESYQQGYDQCLRDKNIT